MPESNILFKASPSTSELVEMNVKRIAEEYKNITYISGTKSIEREIMNDDIKVIITEMFSLAALFMICHSDRTRIISIASCIVRDYNTLIGALTERMKIKRYRTYALSFQSISQHIMKHLSEQS